MARGFVGGLKLVGPYYHYKFKVDGKTIHGSTRTRDKAEAQRYLHSVREEARRVKGVKPTELTFGVLSAMYQESTSDRSVGFKSRYNHGMQKWVLPILGDLPVESITVHEISKLKKLYLETPSPWGKEHNIGGLRTILIDVRSTLNFALNQGLIERLPVRVQVPKAQQRPIRAFSVSELNEFLATVDQLTEDPQVRLAIRMMAYCGFRIGEIRGMRWIWFRNGFEFYVPGLTKGKEADPIPVPEHVADLLGQWKAQTASYWTLRGHPIPPTVFWGEDGRPRSAAFTTHTIKKAAKVMGQEESFSPHALRATCATSMAAVGVSAHHIQQVLRHKSLSTTLHYVKITETDIRTAQNRMIAAVNEPKTHGGEENDPTQTA